MHREARVVLDSLGLDYDTRALAADLGVAQQQMVEIAKALSQRARILVMDEPTAALSERESKALFALIRQLRASGVAIVYISHRMQEVFELGDRVTVLRDGRRVATLAANEATSDQLIGMMVGRAVGAVYKRRQYATAGKIVLDVRGLTTATGVRDVDLIVREGEIVGLSGLVGAGRTEVARAVFGADAVVAGEVHISGAIADGGPERTPRARRVDSENRKLEGLAQALGSGQSAGRKPVEAFPRGWYRAGPAYRHARDRCARHAAGAAAAGPGALGRQPAEDRHRQVAAQVPAVPVRRADAASIGAKSEIFALIEELVERGAAVLLISSELAKSCTSATARM
jgi:ribose transport system ATP-binding protein